jgi:hypothetical protein
MDWWCAFPSSFEAALNGSLAPWAREIEAAGFVPDEATRRALVSDLDVALLEVLYGAIAGSTRCSACGAPLRPDVRVVPGVDARVGPRWPAAVVTRCRGWRRHRHVATVDGPRDLELGPLGRP